MHELLMEPGGKPHFLLGNEAIVRGALEAGVRFVAAYPGTPSSEIIERFTQLAPEAGIYTEYSVNEKVSVEVSCAAAISGVRSLCAMKHVGLNVAADAFMTLAYVGVKAGMVIVVADDPFLHSSQNEQDTRYYAKLAGVPMLEPATPEEAYRMVIEAFEISEKFKTPCLLRTTTRVNHCRGPVSIGSIPARQGFAGSFAKDPFNLVVIPAVGRKLRLTQLERLKALRAESNGSPLNFSTGRGELGIITSGVSYLHVRDAVRSMGLEDRVRILKLGFSYPQPQALIGEFLRSVKKALVVEEIEPFVEEGARLTAQTMGISTLIAGKGEGLVPREFELDPVKVKRAISTFFEIPFQEPAVTAAPQLPQRPPNLCPGCPHRATYYSVKQVFGEEAIYPTDIGCYTLGILPPLKAADFLICMGSGVSTAGGFSTVLDSPVVAFIGDSTFFHAGITGLINAVANNHRFLLVILDNGTTAMTGHQPHPGVELTPQGRIEPKVSIEKLVRGCGVNVVETVNPLQVKKTQKVLQELKANMGKTGVSVLISKSPCPLFENRILKKTKKIVFQSDGSCDDTCGKCMKELGCPAFAVDTSGEKRAVRIDENLCIGCSVCSQICDAIKPKRIS
ncbi:MAG: indolepyruvate ferredoxin oxidoreductase subunit alpha [Desulfobacteraceae bacterium]|nr:indolepyruvate ferredoxin oxidoreductase subunit alpha [Desulfobacteraceae bacterium]